MSALLILYRGALGRRAAARASSTPKTAIVDLADRAAADAAIAALGAGDRAIVLLSDIATADAAALADRLRAAGVRWTSAYAGPTMIRVGPLGNGEGTCFRCATQRYLSAPGAPGLARFEKFVQSGAAGASAGFEGYPATVAEMLVAEALRQVDDLSVPAGFIRKVGLLDFEVTDAVAPSVHGCACAGAHGAPGERFHRRLRDDLSDIFEQVQS